MVISGAVAAFDPQLDLAIVEQQAIARLHAVRQSAIAW